MLYVRHRNERHEIAVGEARPGVPMTDDAIVPWMSSGKPLTAVATLRLVERGLLDLDDPVTQHLPEFAGGGKDGITIRHLLTHTAGLQGIEHDWPRDDWDTVVARIADGAIPDDWPPGERAAYDPANGWFVLGEIVARLCGKTYAEAMGELVLDPAGLAETYCGVDPSAIAAVRDRLGTLYVRSRNGLVPRDEMLEPPHVTSASPGGNFRGPIHELGRFYESLDQLLPPGTLEALTARQRVGLRDETFQHDLDYGLGVIVDSNRHGPETVPYGFGPHCSERTFGHGGVQSSIGFRDPEHDLVVAWVTNGMIGEPPHQRRNRAINTAIYEDLGLA